MAAIHQIYCTHCTYGNSALKRHTGRLASKVLGYSVRSGSLQGDDLRRCYEQIERNVYYYLPRDTPSEAKLQCTAASGPKRLAFFSADSGVEMIAQVCWRQTDTAGRPGSYFAHVLCHEKTPEERWNSLDCLRLWSAPLWVEEDSPDIPFLLQPLSSLTDLLGDQCPAIDDDVFVSFLTTPTNGLFNDSRTVIPERWRQKSAEERRRIFATALHGYLQTRRLLIVVEPSMAALMFYGMLRLLPPGPFRERVEFSTFEPNTDRIRSCLTATWFHDPWGTDLPSRVYRSSGFAVNTCADRSSQFQETGASYAQVMVSRLAKEGWVSVDAVLDYLELRRPQSINDLERLVVEDRVEPPATPASSLGHTRPAPCIANETSANNETPDPWALTVKLPGLLPFAILIVLTLCVGIVLVYWATRASVESKQVAQPSVTDPTPTPSESTGPTELEYVEPTEAKPPGPAEPHLSIMVALDSDGDGQISAEEIGNGPAALKKLDRDEDGRISRQEVDPADADRRLRQRGGGGRGQRGGNLLFRTLDTDADGDISAKEIENAVTALQKLDKNRDGELKPDEVRPEGGRGGPGGRRGPRGGQGGRRGENDRG
jgi:hypothetical protein